jgi:IS1 family transposase
LGHAPKKAEVHGFGVRIKNNNLLSAYSRLNRNLGERILSFVGWQARQQSSESPHTQSLNRQVAFGYVSSTRASVRNDTTDAPLMVIFQGRNAINLLQFSGNDGYSFNYKFWPQAGNQGSSADVGCPSGGLCLFPYHKTCTSGYEYQQAGQPVIDSSEFVGSTPRVRLFCGFWMCFGGEIVGVVGIGIAACARSSRCRSIGCVIALIGCCGLAAGIFSLLVDRLPWEWRQWMRDEHKQNQSEIIHNGHIVPRKYLTSNSYWGTVIDMANVLNTDKQIAVIGALAEGSSIRSIERITGVHRDTIMRLGVKVGQGCAKILDLSMRNLPCNRLEMDEIWGFVGKKERNVREGEDGVGSIWTFCAIDAETKLVPAFKCGDRDAATAKAFVQDVANRMAYRVQISTDGLHAYVAAMESAYGEFVDYGQIIKTYGHEEVSDNRRYSAPKFVSSEKKIVVGNPDERLISTSYVERLNATTRLHMRRLTRLTLAFSKKRENFEAAVALHFTYYNFVKRHNTLRCTPAMAAGVTGTFWSVGDLLEAVA